MSATITVAGTAVVPAQPDEVAIGIALSHLAPTPDAAITEVAARSRQLETIFDEMQIGRDRWTTSGVSVNEEREWDGQRQIHRGYRAGTRVQLRVADAELVGKVMHESVRRCQASIDGPTWLIAPDNPAHDDARRRAATSARAKAETYAAALGVRLGTILSVTEPGLSAAPPSPMPKVMRTMAMDAAPEITVQSGDLDISATVIVTFGLEQG
ncbi:MAG TPA: SIMPL domain-containing protein [Thermomicrobiales bacterium]|nr:SIMPL domain-containing protein [Thermomicrobiales bacterium]